MLSLACLRAKNHHPAASSVIRSDSGLDAPFHTASIPVGDQNRSSPFIAAPKVRLLARSRGRPLVWAQRHVSPVYRASLEVPSLSAADMYGRSPAGSSARRMANDRGRASGARPGSPSAAWDPTTTLHARPLDTVSCGSVSGSPGCQAQPRRPPLHASTWPSIRVIAAGERALPIRWRPRAVTVIRRALGHVGGNTPCSTNCPSIWISTGC